MRCLPIIRPVRRLLLRLLGCDLELVAGYVVEVGDLLD
jgi:hypothetical protein